MTEFTDSSAVGYAIAFFSDPENWRKDHRGISPIDENGLKIAEAARVEYLATKTPK